MNLKKRVCAWLLAISMLLFNLPMQALAQPVDATTQTSNFDVADSVNIDADSAGSGADSTSGDADSTSSGADSTGSDADSTSGDVDSTGSDADSTISDADSTSSGADSTGGDTDPAGSGADSTSGDADSTSSGADSTGGDTDPTGSGADSTSGDADPTGSGADSTSGDADSTGGDTDPAGSGADSTSRDADVNSTDTTTDTSNYAVFSANGGTTSPSKITIEGEDYYQLGSKEDLAWFAGLVNGTLKDVEQDLDANAILTDDITLNKNVLNANGTLNADLKDSFTEWTPIGNYNYKTNSDNIYTGTFDGDGHSITGLYVYENSSDYGKNHHLALIGYLGSGGTVKDLTVSGSITGEQYLAGICSYVVDATVENCTSKVAVTVTRGDSGSSKADVGGVCGHVESSTITGCTYDGILTTYYRSDRAGGICGYILDSKIKDCSNNGTVTYREGPQYLYATFVGGICGYADQTSIESCHNTESAIVETKRSDIIGTTDYGNCGGICGYLGKGGSLSSCTNAGTIRNNAENTGGICGKATSSDIRIIDCVNSGTVEGDTNTAGIVGSDSRITVQNCTNTGKVSGTSSVGGISGYPYFSYLYDCKNEGDVSGTTFIGGILGNAIQVSLVQNCQNSGAITGTSHVGGILGYAGGTLEKCQNSGTVSAEGSNAGGIAGYLDLNSDVQNCTNTATVTGQDCVGGIFGKTDKSVTISNNENTGNVSGKNYVGGLAGYGSSVSLLQCQNESGTVTGTGDYVGGLCGYYAGSSYYVISGSYNTAAVTGDGSYVGGICGYSEGYLSTIYNTGNVVGGNRVGGICGQQVAVSRYSESVECFYNTGDVTGNEYVGGICGYGSAKGTGFYSGYTTGTVTGNAPVGGIIGDAEDDDFLSRCYYLNTSIDSSVDSNVDRRGAYPSTADDFTNGMVCYGMGSSSSPRFWVQNVDQGFDDKLDSYPLFKTFRGVDSPSHVVYKRADDVVDYINHVYEHDYKYAVSTTKTKNDTLERTCMTAPYEDCKAIRSTAVISAKDVRYDEKPHGATVTYSETWPDNEKDLKISYAQKNSDWSSSTTPLQGPPTKRGTYIATITKDDQTASVTYKIIQYYPINYVIKSNSSRWTLPKEVEKSIRENCLKDAPHEIEHGQRITTYPTINEEYQTFKTESGTWEFYKWSGLEYSGVTEPVTLTCTFMFTPNTYDVTFAYKSADDTPIPQELLEQLTTSATVKHGSDVRLPCSVGEKFDVSDGYWVVKEWSGDGKDVTSDITLTATLEYVKAYKVNYAVEVEDSSKTIENAYLDFAINLYIENLGREPTEEELESIRDEIPALLEDLNESLYEICAFDYLNPYHSTGDKVTPYLLFDKFTASDTALNDDLAGICDMLGISLQFGHWEIKGAENKIPVVIGDQSVTFTAVWKAVKADTDTSKSITHNVWINLNGKDETNPLYNFLLGIPYKETIGANETPSIPSNLPKRTYVDGYILEYQSSKYVPEKLEYNHYYTGREPQIVTVRYQFADYDKLPESVQSLLPPSVEHVLETEISIPVLQNVIIDKGTWVFNGWDEGVFDESTNVLTFTATWTFKQEIIPSPDPGETPDNGSNNGSDSGSNTPAKTPAPAQNVSAAAAPAAQAAAAVIPQTGDDSQPLMWVVLAAGSLGLLAVLLAAKRRRTDK